MVQPEVIIVPAVFAIPALVVLARMWFRHKERMATLAGAPVRDTALEQRLERIEQAVETVAIEIERMGEGQRFVTKLLAARAPAEPAPRETLRTPH
jgi:deoxyribose-phosphate aldolase